MLRLARLNTDLRARIWFSPLDFDAVNDCRATSPLNLQARSFNAAASLSLAIRDISNLHAANVPTSDFSASHHWLPLARQ